MSFEQSKLSAYMLPTEKQPNIHRISPVSRSFPLRWHHRTNCGFMWRSMPVVVKNRTLITGLLCLAQRQRAIQVGANGIMYDSANTPKMVSSGAGGNTKNLKSLPL